MDLNPFDDIGRGLKKIGGKISSIANDVNPVTNICQWVKREIKISELKIKYWVLETIQQIMDGGIDKKQAEIQKEIDELEGK